jgi:hypothetical protein
MSKFTPEVYKVVEKYVPKLAPVIREANPTLVKETAEGKEGRQAQLDALRRLKSVAAGGVDPLFSGAMAEAAQRSQTEAQSRSQSLLQDFARRGQMGSGMQLAAQLSGQEQAMSDQASASRAAAMESYRNRLQALRDSAGLGGQISDSDWSRQSQNAGIINAFNQRLSQNAQNQANLNTGIMNDGSKFNINLAQDVADKNVDTTNEFGWKNKIRDDGLKDKIYMNEMGQIEYLNNVYDKEHGWKVKERDRQDDIVKSSYNHDLNVLNGQSGLGGQQMQMNTQTAQDTNSGIQGVSNAAASGYMYSQNNDDEEYEQWKKDKAKKKGGEG